MTDEPSARDPVGEDARIESLDERLKALRAREEGRSQPKAGKETDASYRLGNRVLSELLGGVAGGLFLGWLIGHFSGYMALSLMVMLFVGIGVAFRNIIRITSQRPD
ncbi:AtpZ/AtpI family protein [Novosphingobium sp. Leaf2]|uniref:AtpZ/AtpI family protein n=1 Tax=Novosphingobium sp. Leaf2 TaxID=1735670 RepID=UPI0006FC6C12|nr:ATP synthase I [Novosphingobium sp. Leaf2]KQM18811.1 ATP synthase I [Novosphingobium sp. Leaf2]